MNALTDTQKELELSLVTSRLQVGFYVPEFLPPSHTFIARQILAMKNTDATVVAQTVENIERFGLQDIAVHKLPTTITRSERLIEQVIHQQRQIRPLRQAFYSRSLKQCDVVHVHFGNTAAEFVRTMRKSTTPLIATFHGYDASMMLLDPTMRGRYRALFDRADLLLTVSKRMRDRLINYGAPAEKVACHYIGVPMQPGKAEPVAKVPGLVVQVGRFVEKKGFATTVNAFAEVCREVDHATLELIGNGPLQSAVRQQVSDLGLQNRVQFLGELPYSEVEKRIAQAEVFVHPSETSSDGDEEGLPTAIVESMSLGTCVVSTKHAGIPEVVQPSAGILVDERDVDGLAKGIADVLSNAQLRRQFEIEARHLVAKNFDLQRNSELLEIVYKDIARRDTAQAVERLTAAFS